MIMDKNLLMSNAQAITSSAPSTDVIDLGVLADYGIGEPSLKVLAVVTEAFVSAGGATLVLALQGSTDNVTFHNYASMTTAAVADLSLGARLFEIDLPRPPPGKSMPSYFRMQYTVSVSTFSAGKVTVALVLDRQDNNPPNYPAGVVIAN
jgi:hypothetical protein